MFHIALQIRDEQKANLFVEMLSAMNFVEVLEVNQVNGHSATDDDQESIFYQDPRQSLMRQEEMAFKEMHPLLVEHYLGQYVAIYQGTMVDYDLDEVQLADRIQATHSDVVVLIRKVEERLPQALIFCSPRLVPAQ